MQTTARSSEKDPAHEACISKNALLELALVFPAEVSVSGALMHQCIHTAMRAAALVTALHAVPDVESGPPARALIMDSPPTVKVTATHAMPAHAHESCACTVRLTASMKSHAATHLSRGRSRLLHTLH